jgi:hypothetical protein
MKKAEGLSMGTIVIAAICLIVLVVIIIIFTKNLRGSDVYLSNCKGDCTPKDLTNPNKDVCIPAGGYKSIGKCTDDQVCCSFPFGSKTDNPDSTAEIDATAENTAEPGTP